MSIYPPRRYEAQLKRTELDILKAEHKFLRTDDGDAKKDRTWDEQLARKYEDSLFREFAICDLKHYKSGNVSMRWRTEDEVLSGAGETTCGNTRCELHPPPKAGPSSIVNVKWDDEDDAGRKQKQKKQKRKPLLTLELPFSYAEDETVKTALVKVVLCEKCVRKINWKREKEKEGAAARNDEQQEVEVLELVEERPLDLKPIPDGQHTSRKDKSTVQGEDEDSGSRRRRRRSSRSLSPRSRVRYGTSHDIRDQWQ